MPFHDIDVPSAVEVFTTLRHVNLHLLTDLLTFPGLTGYQMISVGHSCRSRRVPTQTWLLLQGRSTSKYGKPKPARCWWRCGKWSEEKGNGSAEGSEGQLCGGVFPGVFRSMQAPRWPPDMWADAVLIYVGLWLTEGVAVTRAVIVHDWMMRHMWTSALLYLRSSLQISRRLTSHCPDFDNRCLLALIRVWRYCTLFTYLCTIS